MATKGLCQRCVRELIGASRASRLVAAADISSQSSELYSVGEWPLAVSEHPNSLSSVSWGGRTRTFCSASGHYWSPVRPYNSATARNSISGDKISLEYCSRLGFSTLARKEQNATESFSTETSASTRTAAVDADASVQEFIPEIENTPFTPLVEAIQSQESVAVEELSPSAVEHSRSDTGIPSNVNFSPASDAQIDSGRVVQPGRIYVGGLPFSVKGDDLRDGLRELCGKYGTVVEVSLAQHRNQSQKSIEAGKHRGFAFVTMETPETAQMVIDSLNGASAWGRVLMVSYGLRRAEPGSSGRLGIAEKSAARCKVFIGNLHEGTSRLDIENKFQQYGTIVDVKLITELHSSRSRGFGFVTFAEEGEAIRAVLDSDGSILDGSVVRVNIAKYPQGY